MEQNTKVLSPNRRSAPYGTGYQTVWEIRPSAETPSGVHRRRYSCTWRIRTFWMMCSTNLFTYLLATVERSLILWLC